MPALFEQFYNILEMQDTTRNREALIDAYGLDDGTQTGKERDRAQELIKLWTMYSPLIKPEEDYGFPRNIPNIDPRDIFSWARVARLMRSKGDEQWTKLDALQNLEGMIENLKRVKANKRQEKLDAQDYDVVHVSDYATMYRPKSTGASKHLGRATQWCTAGDQNNQFDSYCSQGVILFYVITKAKKQNTATAVWPPRATGGSNSQRTNDFAPEEKYAIAMYPDGETMQVFDAEDDPIEWSDWQDIADGLELPSDKKFYQQHGPNPVDVLKGKTEKATNIMSGAVSRDLDNAPGSNWELLHDLFSTVKSIFRDTDGTNRAKLKVYRREHNIPDEAFLMEVLDMSSLQYFLDSEYNPPGSSEWSNRQFQQEIVRHIKRLKTLTKQANGDDWNEDVIHDMDDQTRMVSGPSDGDDARNIFWQMLLYVKRHMNGEWSELEDALIDLWMTNHAATNIIVSGGYSEHTDGPMDDSMMWLRMLMELKQGEWNELEQAIQSRVEMVLSQDPDNKNLRNGLISMGLAYNFAANHQRGNDRDSRRVYLPASDEHLDQYADGSFFDLHHD